MSSVLVGIIGILVLIILLFSGVSVAMSMFLVGFFGYAYMINLPAAMGVIKTVFYTHASSYTLTTIPLFTLMGQFIFQAGISGNLYKTAHAWLGRVPGGLAVSTEAACAIFAAMCGSSTATAATFATVSYPEMRRYKYNKSLAAGSITSGGTLGILIPPSGGFILFGTVTGLSVGRLFAAGILPGLLLTCLYSAVIIIQVLRHPDWAPKAEKCSMEVKLKSLVGVIPTVVLFGIVMGGIFGGFFTPNEGAAIGALGGFLMMVIAKRFSWKAVKDACASAISSASMIMLIIIAAYVFGYFLSVTRIPANLADYVSSLHVSRYVILCVIVLVFAILGCLMDSAAVILLTVPIFYPVLCEVGFDPIWIGVVVVMMDEMGLITPPVGMNLFVTKGTIGEAITLSDVIKGTVPHLFALLAALLIITVFPSICTWLPSLLYNI